MWAVCLKIGEKAGYKPRQPFVQQPEACFLRSKVGTNYYATFSMLSFVAEFTLSVLEGYFKQFYFLGRKFIHGIGKDTFADTAQSTGP